MKYIPAEKLIAEIERRIGEVENECKNSKRPQYSLFGKINGFEQVLNLLSSLQQEQPECLADTDKTKTLDELMEEVQRYYSENFAYITSDQPTLSILTNIARHFAEWGAIHLNTRKEE